MSGTNKIVIILAVAAMILALSAALIKYFRFNEIDMSLIGAGLAIPAIIIAIASVTKTGKK